MQSLRYNVQFKPRAVKDIEGLPSRIQAQILARIEEMSNDLKGDVRRLTILHPSIGCVLGTIECCLRLRRARSSYIGFAIGAKRTDERRLISMVTLHAQIIKKNGKKDYVVLPYEEFLKVQEELEDYDDLRFLREAKEMEKDAPTVGMAELKKKIRRRTSRSTRRAKKVLAR